MVDGHLFTQSFEIVGRSRPMDLGWVEQTIAKHQSLPTDRLLLVSFAGYPDGSDPGTLICGSLSGSYSTTAACPTAGRVGRCTLTDTESSTVSVAYRFSYYAPTTTLTARGQCPSSMPAAHTTYAFEEN
jgi:hypothetical protein